MTSRKCYYLSSAAIVLLFANGMTFGLANAQEQDNVTSLETITVDSERADGPVGGYVARASRTGTKTDTPIVKTPQTISVVSREQMTMMNAQSAAEALRFTPGVVTEYRGASNLNDEILGRGFSYLPRYQDGLLYGVNSSFSKLNPYLLERVELISGPASVLYGQASPGGLVNMVSKKPTNAPLREVEMSIGNRSHTGLSFDFSDQIPNSETLSYRLVGTGMNSKQQENFTKRRAFAIAPSLTWAPTDQTTLTLLSGYQNEPYAGFRNFLEPTGTIKPIPGFGYLPRNFYVSDPNYERSRREQAWFGYELEHQINDVFTFRQNARFQHTKYQQSTLVWNSLKKSPATGLDTLVSRVASSGESITNQFAIDNQLQANFDLGDGQHTLLAGLDYRNSNQNYRWYRGRNVPDIEISNPSYGHFDLSSINYTPSGLTRTWAQQTGIYLQDQIEIGNLNLSLGGRYDWASTLKDDLLIGKTYDYRDNHFTWRAGALYSFDNGISPYVSYSTSFEPTLTTPEPGMGAFKPMTAKQYEVGVKYAPENTDLLFTGSLYDLTQYNSIESQWNPALGRSINKQVGEIHIRGLELSARGKLTDQLSIIAGYSLTDSETKQSLTLETIGKALSRVPKHQASLWLDYAFDDGPLNGVTIGGGVRYTGTSWGDSKNTFTVDPYALFDASVSYDFGAANPDWSGLSLKFNVKNIADKTFASSCANTSSCFYGEGRTFMATLKRSW